MFRVYYLDSVEKDLKKFDRATKKRILDKIEGTLARAPTKLGQSLSGPLKGFWRYGIGDFRVIYRVSEKEILITVVRIGHRKNVYDSD